MEIEKEKLGPNHVDVSYIHLGNVYYKKDDLEKAKDYYERALEIRKEQLGPNHVDVATSFPGSSLLFEERPWLGLVTCLTEI
jgi:tetratricopeptide (TPR) repeat protein